MKQRIDAPVQSMSILRNRRRWVVLLLVVTVIAASVILYDRPAHILPVGADRAVWERAVRTVNEDGTRALNSCLAPGGDLSRLAGLGTISSICTWGIYQEHPLKIRFVNGNGVGLLYMTHQLSDWSLQVGYCSYPLGGPWYELTLTSHEGTSCLRGFSSLPAP